MNAAIVKALPKVGEYATDGTLLLRVIDISSGGELVLENCADESIVRLSAAQATDLRIVRPSAAA